MDLEKGFGAFVAVAMKRHFELSFCPLDCSPRCAAVLRVGFGESYHGVTSLTELNMKMCCAS